MTRFEANIKILEKLRELAALHADWRFHQILQNFGVEVPGEDFWHEESEETLKKLESIKGVSSFQTS